MDDHAGVIALQNLRRGKFALLVCHVLVAAGLGAVRLKALVAGPEAVLAHIARAVVGSAPEDDAARGLVETHEDVGIIAHPPMPLPFGCVVESGIDRAEFAGAFRTRRHAAELQRLCDFWFNSRKGLSDFFGGQRLVVDLHFVQQSVDQHWRLERRAVFPLCAIREGLRMAQAQQHIHPLRGSDRARGWEFTFEFSVDKHLEAAGRVVTPRDIGPLEERELGFRIALEPLSVLRHMHAQAALAADAKEPALLVVTFLVYDRRPVPRVFLQGDPTLERKCLAQCRSLVGLADEVGGEAVELQGVSRNSLRQCRKSRGFIMNFCRRFVDRLGVGPGAVDCIERPPGGGLFRVEKW